MKHSIKHLSPTKVTLSITLDSQDLASVRPESIKHLAKHIKVAGFRPGKVPAAVAEKNLDPSAIAQQLLEDAVNKYLIEAINAAELRVLDRPQIDLGEFKPGEALDFKAEIEILPEVKLGDYKKLKVKKTEAKVTDAEIDEVLERMQKGYSEKIATDQAAKDGDEVVIDFEGTDKDGKPVPGATGNDYPLALGSKTFIPGFEEGLAGKKVGDVVDLPLTFPKDYHHKPLAGALVNFKVTVKTVNQIKLPKLDDEFAAKTGQFKTLADLKDDVKTELTKQKQQQADDQLKDDLLEKLLKVSDVPAPQVLVQDQIESLERDRRQNLMYRGQSVEQILEDEKISLEDWRQREFGETAERRVKIGLLLAEVSRAEKIDLSKEELQARLDEMLAAYKDESFRKQMDTPEARRDLANRMITEKTLERLVELSSK